ncbi:MAG: tol-pal system protein YbgF [Thermodesulfobacteriota bacterium]|nr:tol-pal system protein YbgF [Thermodesulfobacteriota bacterium]
MFTSSASFSRGYLAGRTTSIFVLAILIGFCTGCAALGPQKPQKDDRIEEVNKKLDTIYHRLSVIQFMLDDHERILRGLKTDAPKETEAPAKPEAGQETAAETSGKQAKSEATTAAAPSPQALYEEAIGKYRNQQYDDALSLFQQFAKTHPGHDLADNALYWAGECLYSQKNFEAAIPIFKQLIRKYPEGNKKPDALLKTGYAYISLSDKVNGEMYLKNVIRNYPFSDAAEKAKQKLGTLE